MPARDDAWIAARTETLGAGVRLRADRDAPCLLAPPEALPALMPRLRDDPEWRFEMLIDLAGLDYAEYGRAEWATHDATARGFSRAVDAASGARSSFDRPAPAPAAAGGRFAVAYQLLSPRRNRRLRVLARCADDDAPALPTVTGVWPNADWYEREAFDLFGIVFEGHPDLRRILTDYGFIGHPLRRDFPLVGHVEARYDPAKRRVVYQPVTIAPRVTVPKVRRGGGHA